MVTVIVGARRVLTRAPDDGVRAYGDDEDEEPNPDDADGLRSHIHCCSVSAGEAPSTSFVVGGDLARNEAGDGQPKWVNYIKGVINEYYGDIQASCMSEATGSSSAASSPSDSSSGEGEGGYSLGGDQPVVEIAFNAVIISSVPQSAGLASSAALEVAFATFLEKLYNLNTTYNPNSSRNRTRSRSRSGSMAAIPLVPVVIPPSAPTPLAAVRETPPTSMVGPVTPDRGTGDELPASINSSNSSQENEKTPGKLPANAHLPYISPVSKALRCVKAEHEFAGVPCGVMDQFISVMGTENHLLLLDCMSRQYKLISFDGSYASPVLVIINSNVDHSTNNHEYAARVEQCKQCVAAVREYYKEMELNKTAPPGAPVSYRDIRTMRDVSLEMLERVHSLRSNSRSPSVDETHHAAAQGAKARAGAADHTRLSPLLYRRGRHVITENMRVLETVAAVRAHDWQLVGKLMTDSHASLSADYEVSCGEADLLVDIALSVPGVYGSRITGGGFGGCIVALVERNSVATLKAEVAQQYRDATGLICQCYEVLPSAGN